MDLTTQYAGLELANPFIAGASPITFDLNKAKMLEQAGAAAIVMRSLVSEQMNEEHAALNTLMENISGGNPEASSFFEANKIDSLNEFQDYVTRVTELKEALSIPVIASVSGGYATDWHSYVREVANAGADAVELSLYQVPLGKQVSAAQLEDTLVESIASLRSLVDVPLIIKLAPFYTSLCHLAERLKAAGADAVVLFNRFYHVDIDIQELELKKRYGLSSPEELPQRLMWAAALSPQIDMPIAISGGVHSVEDGIKSLMAGATVVQMTSALLQHGPNLMQQMVKGLDDWLTQNAYKSLDQLRGSMNIARCPQPELYTRINHIKELALWWGNCEKLAVKKPITTIQ